MHKNKRVTGAAVTIGKTADKMTTTEKLHYACFKARAFYFQTTGNDLPIERFEAYVDDNGDIIVTLKEAENGQ